MVDSDLENTSATPGTSPENYFRFGAAALEFDGNYCRFSVAILEIDRGPQAGHGTVNHVEIERQTTKIWRDGKSGELRPRRRAAEERALTTTEWVDNASLRSALAAATRPYGPR